MMFKFSKYCITNSSPHNEMIIFNTLNGKMVKFGASQNILKPLISAPFEYDESDPLHSFLKENQFIVPENYDEFYRAKKYCNMVLKNNNVLSLIVMPTMACNFRCSYCYENHETVVFSETVKKSIVSYITENIAKFDSVEIQWFGGEPLLQINDMVSISRAIKTICAEKGKSFRSSITTNGYLLDSHTIDVLYNDCNTRMYMITLDGGRETHNSQRPHIHESNSYDAVIAGLINLKKTQYDFQIVIRTNVTKKMMQYDMEQFFNEMNDLFGADGRFSFMIRRVFGLPELETASLNDMKELYSIMYQIGLKITTDYRLSYGGNGICYAAKRYHYCIGPDGSVYKCSVQFSNENNQIGSILDPYFDQSKKLEYWEQSTERFREGERICRNCEYYPICAGISCPANIRFDLKKNTCTIYDNYKIVNEQIIIHSNNPSLCLDWDRKGK